MSRLRNRRLALSALTGITQRFAQLATALITLPLVLHSLGPAGFGIWGAAISLAWVSGLLDVGLSGTLISLVPPALAAGRPAAPLVSAAFYSSCAVSAVLLAGCALAAAHGMAPVFLIAGVTMALTVPLGLSNSLWFAVQKGHAAGLWDLAQTLLTLFLLLLAAFLHPSVIAMVAAVYGALFLVNLASMTVFFLMHPHLRPGRTSRLVWRDSLRGGSGFFIMTVATLSGYAFDTLLALHWLGPDAAAGMTVVMRVCMTALGFLTVATQAFWPAFAEAAHTKDVAWIRRALWQGTAALVAVAAGGAMILVALGPILLPFWLGSKITLPPLVWAAIALWVTVQAVPKVIGLYLNAAGMIRPQVFVLVLANVLALGAKYLLAPGFGIAGILAATPLLWIMLVCPAYLWWGWQQTQKNRA
jgi:O-antigen/teichoic acid export membrane protein